MRKFVIALVLMLGIVFIIGRSAELQVISETLRKGDWHFIFLALGIEIAWLFTFAASFRAIYRCMGIEEKIETLVCMVAAANFVNVVAPSAGVSGIAVFIAEARRRNYSPARATVAGAVYVLFDYLGFLCVLGLGLIVLIRRNNLTTVEIAASAILVSIATVLVILLYLGTRSAQALGKALAWMAHQVNRVLRPILHREYLSEQRAHEFAHEAANGLIELRCRPYGMLLPAGLALLNKAFLVFILLFMFLAFKVPISAGTVIAGFSIGYLFLIVSPTPAGLGVVEGILTLTLRSMYIPLEAAALITLSYRAITFWAPLFFGMVALRLLEKVGVGTGTAKIPELPFDQS